MDFIGFYLNDQGRYVCRFKEAKADVHKIEEIQAGILEFVGQYSEVREKIKPLDVIAERDAYAPMVSVENRKNRKYMKNVCGLMDEMNL